MSKRARMSCGASKPTAKVRKEDLIKWQEKRKALKAEEDAKRRPPFVVGRYVLGEETSKRRARDTTTLRNTKKSKIQKKGSKPIEGVKQPLKDGHSSLNIQQSPQQSQGTKKKAVRGGDQAKKKYGSTKDDEDRRSSSPSSLPAKRSTVEDITSAWMPGGVTLPTPQNQPIDKLLTPKPFSPFQFTASNKDEDIEGPSCTDGVVPTSTGGEDHIDGHASTSNDVPISPSKEQVLDDKEDVSKSNETTDECSYIDIPTYGRSDDSIDNINHTIYHNHEMANTINNDYHQVDTNSPALPPEVNNDQSPSEFAPFRKLHDDVVEKFTRSCQEWEGKEATMKDKELAIDTVVEVCDQIRTTVCQARLLMRSKLNQFIELVEKAEDPDQPLPTTAEDLRGFWDMVYFQVTDVEAKFNCLQSLEDNNWQEQKPEKKAVVIRKKRRRSLASSKKKTPSDKLKAARARIAEQRKELKKKISANRKGTVTPSSPAVPVTISAVKDGHSPAVGLSPAPKPTITPSVKKRGSFLHPGELSSTPLPKRLCLPRSAKRKSINVGPSETGHVTELVRLTPSKSMIERFGSDMIVSPARRSVRIQRKSVGVASGPVDDDIPLGCNFVYKPNKLIDDY